MINKRIPTDKKHIYVWSLILFGVCLLAGAGFLYFSQYGLGIQPTSNEQQPLLQPSSDELSEATISNYTVAPELPKYIEIPAIRVPKTRILHLGISKNNEVAVPDNIHDTGWYNASKMPGQSGAMFVYGHVSNWQAEGVFYDLSKLHAGDKIIITRGDDKQFTYQVVSSKTYDYQHVDMNQVLAPVSPDKPGLNLMTCAGQVIKDSSEFSQRLVVFTSLVNL